MNKKKMMLVVMGVLFMGLVFVQPAVSQAKTVKKSMTMNATDYTHKHLSIFKKATKVKVKNSTPAAIKVKYIHNKIKGRCLYIKAKKAGTATVRVTIYKRKRVIRKYIYRIKVVVPDAKEAFRLQNEERQKNGKSDLQWDENLYEIAQVRAKEITKRFEHDKTSIKKYLGTVFATGENIHYGSKLSDAAIRAWITSEPHHKNMLDDDYKTGAISYAIAPDGTYYWVALFSNRTSEEIIQMNRDYGEIKFSSLLR